MSDKVPVPILIMLMTWGVLLIGALVFVYVVNVLHLT
jgi:hypothetical protein